MNYARLALIGAVTLVVVASCRSVPLVSAGAAEPRALLRVDSAYAARAARTNLVDGTLAMLHDSVVFVRPGATLVRGIDAVRAALESPERRAARVSWAPLSVGVSADGTEGYTAGTLDITWPDGRFDPGRYIAYWHLVAGAWRVVAYRRTARVSGDLVCPDIVPNSGNGQADAELVYENQSRDLGFVVAVRQELDTTVAPPQPRRVRSLCVWKLGPHRQRVVVASG